MISTIPGQTAQRLTFFLQSQPHFVCRPAAVIRLIPTAMPPGLLCCHNSYADASVPWFQQAVVRSCPCSSHWLRLFPLLCPFSSLGPRNCHDFTLHSLIPAPVPKVPLADYLAVVSLPIGCAIALSPLCWLLGEAGCSVPVCTVFNCWLLWSALYLGNRCTASSYKKMQGCIMLVVRVWDRMLNSWHAAEFSSSV